VAPPEKVADFFVEDAQFFVWEKCASGQSLFLLSWQLIDLIILCKQLGVLWRIECSFQSLIACIVKQLSYAALECIAQKEIE
jgi:hypothetical protein